uniref:Uncharacterized protein n=1 Tax=Rhizophagus irregularis (strain DAOM 181602 / DAOM 197198 / MUCL 43194) TaxID=747089 RepID=U9T9N2_RHIID
MLISAIVFSRSLIKNINLMSNFIDVRGLKWLKLHDSVMNQRQKLNECLTN